MTAANRILTSHVGSLARPVRLLDYITAIERGVAVDGGAFEACLKSAVAEVVQQQTRAGVDIVSDGEFGKFRTWSADVLERLGGIEEREVAAATGAGKDQRTFPEFYAQYFHTQNLPKRGVIVAVAPLTYEGQAAIGRDIDNLKSALAAVKVTAGFLPVVAPASAVPRHQNEFYKSDEEFFFALADALREEYAAIINAGLYLQVDDAFLPYMYDVAFADQPIENFRKWAALRIDALNHALRGLPEEKIRYHICWGSFNTPHRRAAARHRRSSAARKGGRLLPGDGEPAPRARVAGVGNRQAARRPQAHSGRRRACHQHRRASRTRGRAHRAACKARRPRQRHCGNRLRLRTGAVHHPGASLDHLGQALSARRRRAPCDQGTLGQIATDFRLWQLNLPPRPRVFAQYL
jgi:methionine synthase II (cobalamin-independent)